MGGSGGGGYREFGRSNPPSPTPHGDGGGKSAKSDPCAQYSEITLLQSPVSKIVDDLRLRQILDLKLSAGVIQARTQKGEVAGAIIPERLKTLIDCMKKGKQFAAEVLEIESGAIKLLIRAKTNA